MVSADTCNPRRAPKLNAKLAQLQRVRHQPYAAGAWPAVPASCGGVRGPEAEGRPPLPLLRSVPVANLAASKPPPHKLTSANTTASRQSRWENDAAPAAGEYASAIVDIAGVNAASVSASGSARNDSAGLRSKRARPFLSQHSGYLHSRCSKSKLPPLIHPSSVSALACGSI